MQPNATELKALPLLTTPDEANQGHTGPILSPGSRRKRGQTGPNEARVHPPPSFPRGGNLAPPPPSDPFSLEGRRLATVLGVK